MGVRHHPRRIALPLPGGQPQATVRVTPLLAGEAKLPPTYLNSPSGRLGRLRGLGLTTPRSRWIWAPVPAFLVEHPGAGAILVDTGFAPSVAENPRESLGWRAGTLFTLRVGPEQAIREQLLARGIDPDAVGLVVMTHLHFDHASGVPEFPAATFVVDRHEWEAASSGGFRHGYRHSHFDHPFDWREIDYGASDVESHETFGRTVDLLGDGSVRLLSTPGHTHGHQSVLLRLAGRSLLLVGDAAYTRRAIAESWIPALYADRHVYLRSLGEIQRYIQAEPNAVVICGHDAESWPTLESVYA
ncbi:MAG: N-acyl homoserine lactonase family protein [Actinobacteria bacterium]|nr:MAG: N-acyl homoserine lactonase family protein [Actinomycetota bacterium]